MDLLVTIRWHYHTPSAIEVLVLIVVLYSTNSEPHRYLVLCQGEWKYHFNEQIDGLVQDCSDSIANALELLQSCIRLQ